MPNNANSADAKNARLIGGVRCEQIRLMNEINLKFGVKIFVISTVLILFEIIIYFLLGISAQAASGDGIKVFFNGFYFLIILTAVVGSVCLSIGVLNKYLGTQIRRNTIPVISIAIAGVIYFIY